MSVPDPSRRVETEWFTAVLPAEVSEGEPTRERGSLTRYFAADVEPFGLFTAEETEIALDAFIAVGAQKWVADFGDHLARRFARFSATPLHDSSELRLGLAARDFTLQADYEGPCLVRARLRAWTAPERERGCVLVCWAFVDAQDLERVDAFLGSVKLATPFAGEAN